MKDAKFPNMPVFLFCLSLSLQACVGGAIGNVSPEPSSHTTVALPLSVRIEMRDYKHQTIVGYSWKDDAFKHAMVHYLQKRGTFRTVVDGPADVVLYLEAKYNFYLFLLLHSCSLEVTLTRGETAGSNDGESLGSYSGHGTHMDTIIGDPTLIRQNTIAEALDDLFVKIDRDRKVILAKTAQKPPLITASNSPTPAAVSQSPSFTDAASDVDRLPAITSKKVNGYAVVIGIEQYREKLPRADFADRDAILMGEYLTKVLGYPEENVVVRTNEKASLTDLIKYFEGWLPNNVEQDSSVFIYYSGHGSPNPQTGGAYLVPYDGDPTFVERTGYPLKGLYAALERLPAKEIIVVLDSCFSGAGGRSVIAQGAKPIVLSSENAMLPGGKIVVFSASAGDQISSAYSEKRHGLLTYFFLRGLQGEGDLNGDGIIEISELFEYIKPQVRKIARKKLNNEQTPQLLSSPKVLQKGSSPLVELRTP